MLANNYFHTFLPSTVYGGGTEFSNLDAVLGLIFSFLRVKA